MHEYTSKFGDLDMPQEKQFWQISPGRKERKLWPEFSKNNIIAIGWDDLGDLRKYSSIDEVEKEIRRRWNEGYNSARSCWYFSRHIKKNDIVVAKYGASKEIYGIGKVTKEYNFNDEREIFKHVIGVHWYIKFEDSVKVDTSKEFVQWTVHSLSEERYAEIKRSILRDYPDQESNFLQLETGEGKPETLHLVYKIAWHPGGYKGGFCGNAQSSACEAFRYVRNNKRKQTCSPSVFHCVDEHEAFSDNGWKVKIHPPRIKRLSELSDGKSLLFLIAPMDKYKTRYRLVGFYTIKEKMLENGKVIGLEAEENKSSKFDLEDPNLELDSEKLMRLFEMQKWTPRSSYEFISSETARSALNKIYEIHKEKKYTRKIHKEKKIADPDVNLLAMKKAIANLQPLAPMITLHDYFVSERFSFEESTVSAFYVALKTKGLVILAGLTGTGKTKLPQLFFELVTDEDEQKLFLSVRPDWRDSKPLVGYFNPIEQTYESTRFLERIFQACDNWKSQQIKLPFFVLLDEMNLARVEYYFADFLSVLESGRDENRQLITKEPISLHALQNCQTRGEKKIPPKLNLPPNLYFAGTVNLDETTYSFSPKVLDRAFVVEFWEVNLENYPPQPSVQITDESKQQLKERILEDLSRNGRFLAYTKEDVELAIKSLGAHFENIKKLNKILADYGLHFGYRVIDEMALFFLNAIQSKNRGIIRFKSEDQIVDYAILMKVLPKIHGNRSKAEIPLRRTLAWTIDPENWSEIIKEFEEESGAIKNEYLQQLQRGPIEFLSKASGNRQIKYPKTAEKVARMIYQLYTTGFTSFL